MKADSDSELWENFRKGDASAYTKLMHLYASHLFRYGLRFAADEEFIKDCIQDVFMELWKRRRTISQTSFVKPYLFKSLRLKIFREYPKWNKNESIDETNYNFIVEFNIETKLIDDQTSNEKSEKLRNRMDLLPKRQKEILYLRFYEGFDHDKISEVMDLSHQSAYNLLHSAISNLRALWFKI